MDLGHKIDIPINIEFGIAMSELPEVPNISVLTFLSEAGRAVSDIDIIKASGKELQRKHGLSAVPPVAEMEWAAGLWSVMRKAVLEARTI